MRKIVFFSASSSTFKVESIHGMSLVIICRDIAHQTLMVLCTLGSRSLKQTLIRTTINCIKCKYWNIWFCNLNFKIGVLLRKWLALWNFSIFHLPVQASGNWMKMIHSLQDRILFSEIFSPFSSSVHFVANSRKSHKWRVTSFVEFHLPQSELLLRERTSHSDHNKSQPPGGAAAFAPSALRATDTD